MRFADIRALPDVETGEIADLRARTNLPETKPARGRTFNRTRRRELGLIKNRGRGAARRRNNTTG